MYTARLLDKIAIRPRIWKVGVFRVENGKEEQIGEYERNYPTIFNTFFPFQQNGKDFALYSPDYTVTRILELPSCKDIGGEEPDSWGFCPVDYFIPTYIEREVISETTTASGTSKRNVSVRRVNNPINEFLSASSSKHEFTDLNTGEECETVTKYRPLTSLLYYSFGFVAGCIWGDESTYKIQYLDLSEAEKGIVKRDERFGYIELPEDLALSKAIDMYDYGYDTEDEAANYIRISVLQTFDLRNGKLINQFD